MDVREPRAAYSRGRLHAVIGRRYLREGSRPCARYRACVQVSVAVIGGCAPDVHDGVDGWARRRGRLRGHQDLPGHRHSLGSQVMTKALLGCIADDFTGATDLANMLVRGGMRAVQTIGVPASNTAIEADALIVALKSRTIPAADAVAQSLAALEWLRAQGCQQFLFKYCSTFDSTDGGNIGPVADALLAALNDDFTLACPA